MTAVAMVTLLPRCGGMAEGQETNEAGALKAVEQQAEAALPAACHPQTRTVWNTLHALGDVSVKEDAPDTNFGGESLLSVDMGPANYESYLGFHLPERGGRLVHAKLRLFARSDTATGVNVHRMRSSWEETTTTWNSRPLVDVPVASLPSVTEGTWAEFDVKDAVSSDRQGFSLGVTAAGLDGVEFDSREASNSARRPRVETAVTYDWCTYRGTGASSLQWTKTLGGSDTHGLVSLVNLPAGGGFVAGGWYQGTGDMGGPTLPAPGGLFVARYDDSGWHQWSRAYAPGELTSLSALTVTPLGNVLVVGTYHGAPDFGTGPLPYVDPTKMGGMFLLKLSPSGTPVWAHGFAARTRPPDSGGREYSAVSQPTAVATDANGSLVVTGYFQGYMDLGTGEIFAGPSSQGNDPTNGIFLAKFDYDGHPLWAQAFPAGEGDKSRALAIAGDGTIYLGGKTGTPTLAGEGAYPNAPFVARFAPDGTRAWARSLRGSWGSINGLAVLPSGGVAFGGDYSGDFTFNGVLYVSEDPTPEDTVVGDAVYGTLTASGADGWVRTVIDGGSGDSVRHVAVDAAGNVTVAGNASMDSFNLGGGTLGTPWLSPYLFLQYVASHGPTGDFRWSRLLGLSTSSVSLAVTPAGATRVGFNFQDIVTTVDDYTFHAYGMSGTGLLQFSP
ncbi:DNRLRE domain-containing protein [Corallococcus exercitus]|uniref:CBM96 family carbohydrate-binding protein n=1 Tax=Corallococcus exercitus TaxID=2316736 RepID=UPI0035D4B15A